ncbi:hypothetical protein WMF30_55725 [Sorangium sp. So ce134]
MSDDQLAKFMSLIDDAENEANRAKQEALRAEEERKSAAQELDRYIASAIEAIQKGTSDLRTAMTRKRVPTKTFSKAADPTKDETVHIGDTQAKLLYLFVFPHPKPHPIKGTIHASIGLARSTINNRHGWRLHEFVSHDTGPSGISGVAPSKHLNIGDPYTAEMVKDSINKLLAQVNGLYIKQEDD